MDFELVSKKTEAGSEPAAGGVETLLAELGLSEYTATFHENAVDLDVLLELTEEEIKVELGVTKLGHRRKLMNALEQYQQPGGATTPSTGASVSPDPMNTAQATPQELRVDWEQLGARLRQSGWGAKKDLSVAPAISAKKLRNLSTSLGLHDQKVLNSAIALIDTTVFGSAKNGLLVCSAGVHIHNSWQEMGGAHHVSWSDFLAHSSTPAGQFNIQLVPWLVFERSGSGLSCEATLAFLSDLRRMARECS